MSVTVRALGGHGDKFRTFGADKAVTPAKPGHILQSWHSENPPGFVIGRKSRLSCYSNAAEEPVHSGSPPPLLSCLES